MVARNPNLPDNPDVSTLPEGWFDRFRPHLLGLIAKSAGSLLRRESIEVVMESIRARAVDRAGRPVDRSDGQLSAWLVMIARQYLAERFNYWNEMRRDATALLRAIDPDDASLGKRSAARALTFAARREHMEEATAALANLTPDERRILRLVADGAAPEQISIHLGIPRDDASLATQDAVQQFRHALASLHRQPIRP